MFFFGSKASRKDLSGAIPIVSADGKLSYRVANLQGKGRRANQEDSFTFGNALEPDAAAGRGMLAVVADGMGGMDSGEKASGTAVDGIESRFRQFDLGSNISGQLEQSVLRAGEEVYSILGGTGGSTVVAAVIYEEKLYFTSVGDSFIYLLRNRQLVRLNRSHNALNRDYLEVIRFGIANPAEAVSEDPKEALTQFLGMECIEETDTLRRPMPLEPGDVLMLCSDGVAGVLSEECMAECLSFGAPMDMCSALDKEIKAINSKYQDNYTALIIQCVK